MSVHSKVRQLVADNKSKIKDKEFFLSKVLAKHFEDIAYGVAQRIGKPRIKVELKWDNSEGATIACTDNKRIMLNAGSRFLDNTDRETRYKLLYGINGHELGHILYTDYTINRKKQENIKNYQKFFPAFPKEARYDVEVGEIKSYLTDPVKASIIAYFVHDLDNILEDGHIENRLMFRYTGNIKKSLKLVRERQFEKFPTVPEAEAKEEKQEDILSSILQHLLSYAKYGEIKFGDADLSNERIQAVFSVMDDVDEFMVSMSALKRAEIGNLIFIKLWAYYKPMIDLLAKQSEENRQYPDLEGISTAGSGGVPMVSNEKNSLGDTRNTSNAKQQRQQSSKSSQGNENDENIMLDNNRNGECEEAEGDGITEYDNDYEGDSDFDAANTVDELVERIAKQQAETTVEQELADEVEEVVASLPLPAIHKRAKITIHRQSSVTEGQKYTYDKIAPDLIAISKGLQRAVKQKLKDYQQGAKLTNLYFGRRIDKNNLIRTDGKIFYNNRLPQDVPQLAVGILIDESGSMSGVRTQSARATAIILHDFCQGLNIPVNIVGHTASSCNVHLYDYCEFDSVDGNDKYRLMDVSARSCNRDGAGILYMCERLAKRPETQKVLFVISDGQPNDTGYGGNAAREDMASIVAMYEKKGVQTIACAIGDDKPNIKAIYGEDRFFDISDLNELPHTMTKKIIQTLKIS